jgi:hypothetical protein
MDLASIYVILAERRKHCQIHQAEESFPGGPHGTATAEHAFKLRPQVK